MNESTIVVFIQRLMLTLVALTLMSIAWSQPFGTNGRDLPPGAQERLDAKSASMKRLESALFSGDYAVASEIATQGLEDYPDDVSFRVLLAECLLRQGKPKEAMKHVHGFQHFGTLGYRAAAMLGYMSASEGNISECKAIWDWLISNAWMYQEMSFDDWPLSNTRNSYAARFALVCADFSDRNGDDIGQLFYLERSLIAEPWNAVVNLHIAEYGALIHGKDSKFYRERIRNAELAEAASTSASVKKRAKKAWTLLMGAAHHREEAERKARMGGG